MTWTLIPVAAGPHIDTRVYLDGVYVGALRLPQPAYADLRARLLDADLHNLHPQPGQPAAAPLPVGVDGWAPGQPATTTG